MERKLTQEELGSLAGVDPAFISQIENGRKNLTLSSVAKLAKALGVPALELFRF
jgi:transcriptional regulator with XRE-family HTH domain